MLLPLGGFFFVLSLIFVLWALFDAVTTSRDQVRNLPKWAWLVLMVIFLEFGALAWVLFGRPKGAKARRDSQSMFGPAMLNGAANRQRSSRPVGPDDDPDFLRGLSKP